MGLFSWLQGLFGGNRRFKQEPAALFPKASQAIAQRIAAALKSPKVSAQCIAALTSDNMGIVLVKEELVKDFIARGFSNDQAAVGVAANLGPLTCRGSMSRQEIDKAAQELSAKVSKVQRLDSAHEVVEGLPSSWDDPVYMVTFV